MKIARRSCARKYAPKIVPTSDSIARINGRCDAGAARRRATRMRGASSRR
jgi:hypothetical protein